MRREAIVEPENPQQTPANGQKPNQFSIRLIMVITVIAAVASAGLGQLYRAANGQVEDIGPFIIITSMAPLGVMIALNWIFRLFGKL